jgi:hypothetical protein
MLAAGRSGDTSLSSILAWLLAVVALIDSITNNKQSDLLIAGP